MSDEILIIVITASIAFVSSILLAIINKILDKNVGLNKLLTEIKNLREARQGNVLNSHLSTQLKTILFLKEARYVYLSNTYDKSNSIIKDLIQTVGAIVWTGIILFVNSVITVPPGENVIFIFYTIHNIGLYPVLVLLVYIYFCLAIPNVYNTLPLKWGMNGVLPFRSFNQVTDKIEILLPPNSGRPWKRIALTLFCSIAYTLFIFFLAGYPKEFLNELFVSFGLLKPGENMIYTSEGLILIVIFNMFVVAIGIFILIKRSTLWMTAEKYSLSNLAP